MFMRPPPQRRRKYERVKREYTAPESMQLPPSFPRDLVRARWVLYDSRKTSHPLVMSGEDEIYVVHTTLHGEDVYFLTAPPRLVMRAAITLGIDLRSIRSKPYTGFLLAGRSLLTALYRCERDRGKA
jgi:hypothetical protein